MLFRSETRFVSQTDLAEWRAAIQPNTKLLFAESPTNPLTEVCDIRALADIAHAAGAWLAETTAFARRRCNGRPNWAPTSSSIRAPSTWTARAG